MRDGGPLRQCSGDLSQASGIAAGGSCCRSGLPGLAVGSLDDLAGALGCLGLEVLAADQGPLEQRAGAQVGDEGVADAGGEFAAGQGRPRPAGAAPRFTGPGEFEVGDRE